MTPDLLRKLEEARVLLQMHGYISDTQSSQIKQRVKRRAESSGMVIVEKPIFKKEQTP